MIVARRTQTDTPRLHEVFEVAPLSLEQYHQMIAVGIIGEDDPLELIDGYLVAKDQGRGPGMGHGPVHAWSVQHIFDTLRAAVPLPWVVRSQLPVTLGEDELGGGKEPEPDIVVADGPEERYRDHHPGPAEIRLLTEVADSSLGTDRRGKAPLYAAAGIALYWIVNLVARQVEVYSDPDPANRVYRSQRTLNESDQATLEWDGLPPVTISVKKLFT